MSRGLGVLLALALFWLPAAVAFAQEGEGLLRGRVVNLTANGSEPGPLQVTLHTLRGGEEQTSRTATTDNEGGFSFSGLPTSPDYTYQVSVTYRGVEYRSQLLDLGPKQTSKDLELAVYDTTASEEAINIDRIHAIVDVDPESRHLRITQVLSFLNAGDRTYVGKGEDDSLRRAETLRFYVPGGATNLRASVNLATVEEAGEGSTLLTVAAPVPPGRTEIVVSYSMAYDSPRLALRTPLAYSTGRVDVFLVDVGAKVTSPQLPEHDSFSTDDTRFVVLSGKSLDGGTPLLLEFKGLPVAGGGGIEARWWALAGLAAGSVIALAYPRLRRGQREAAEAAAVRITREVKAERQDLLIALADLDDQFERGEISEANYRALRSQKRRSLAELLDRQRQGPAPKEDGEGGAAAEGIRRGASRR